MPRTPKPPRDDPAESERFIAIAREIGADENGEAFERTFEKIMAPMPSALSTTRNRGVSRKAPHKGARCK